MRKGEERGRGKKEEGGRNKIAEETETERESKGGKEEKRIKKYY